MNHSQPGGGGGGWYIRLVERGAMGQVEVPVCREEGYEEWGCSKGLRLSRLHPVQSAPVVKDDR